MRGRLCLASILDDDDDDDLAHVPRRHNPRRLARVGRAAT